MYRHLAVTQAELRVYLQKLYSIIIIIIESTMHSFDATFFINLISYFEDIV